MPYIFFVVFEIELRCAFDRQYIVRAPGKQANEVLGLLGSAHPRHPRNNHELLFRGRFKKIPESFPLNTGQGRLRYQAECRGVGWRIGQSVPGAVQILERIRHILQQGIPMTDNVAGFKPNRIGLVAQTEPQPRDQNRQGIQEDTKRRDGYVQRIICFYAAKVVLARI